MYGGIINSLTKLHLVGYCYWLIPSLPLNIPNPYHSKRSYFLFDFYLHTDLPLYLTTCENSVTFSRKIYPFIRSTWPYQVRITEQLTI